MKRNHHMFASVMGSDRAQDRLLAEMVLVLPRTTDTDAFAEASVLLDETLEIWLLIFVIIMTKFGAGAISARHRLTHTNYGELSANSNATEKADWKKKFYAMCDETGRCLGVRRLASTYRSNDTHSNECIRPGFRNCDYIVRFGCNHTLQEVNLELYAARRHGEDSGYVAGALSMDRKMGDDVVVACVWDKTEVHATFSYNLGRTNRPVRAAATELEASKGVWDTHVYCSVLLNYTKLQTYAGEEFLYENVNNVLLAGGPVRGDKLLHHDARMSSTAINFHGMNPNVALDPSYYPEQVHACYMLFIWITVIPTGTFVSRFYKETWARTYFLNRRIWHAIHSGCMLLAMFMALCSYLMVGYDRLQYLPPTGTTEQIHGIIGVVTISLLVLQCLLGWCQPDKPNWRSLVARLHCAFGHLTYVLGMTNIIASPWFTYNVAPKSISRKAITWLSFHLVLYFIMTLYVDWTDRHLQTGGWRAWCGYPMLIVSDEEAPRPTLRKFVLFVFVLSSLIISVLMIETVRFDVVELRTDFGGG